MCRPSAPSGVPGPIAAAAWLVYAAGWLAWQAGRYAVRGAPLALAAAVLGYRWLTGAPFRPAHTGRRYVTRRTRAAGQSGLTVAAVSGALWPVPTALAVALLAVALAATVAATRYRAAAARRPRRVPAHVGPPAPSYGPVRADGAAPALPATPTRTWPAQTPTAGRPAPAGPVRTGTGS
ncbi:MAG: hypothetical protein ACJ768_24605 [Gaiellaceae bacterium]|jgi:hypothetical protein